MVFISIELLNMPSALWWKEVISLNQFTMNQAITVTEAWLILGIECLVLNWMLNWMFWKAEKSVSTIWICFACFFSSTPHRVKWLDTLSGDAWKLLQQNPPQKVANLIREEQWELCARNSENTNGTYWPYTLWIIPIYHQQRRHTNISWLDLKAKNWSPFSITTGRRPE